MEERCGITTKVTMISTPITRAELRELVRKINHAMPIAITAITDCRARKTDNPFGTIRKLSSVSAFAGINYESSINRELKREGKDQLTFTAKPRSFGEHVSPALIRHVNNDGETKWYLAVKVQRAKTPLYLIERGGFRKIVKKDMIAAFLPPERENEGANTACDNPVVYRNYSLENIVKVNMGGKRYVVVD